MRNLIKTKTEGNVVYIEKKQKDTMDLRCSMCRTVKNEMQLKVENGLYKCECGSTDIQGVSRITGYLALDERFGKGKKAERKDRVSHINGKLVYYSIDK